MAKKKHTYARAKRKRKVLRQQSAETAEARRQDATESAPEATPESTPEPKPAKRARKSAE